MSNPILTTSGNPWQLRSVIASNRLPSHHTSQHGNQEPIARLPAPKITTARWGLQTPLGVTGRRRLAEPRARGRRDRLGLAEPVGRARQPPPQKGTDGGDPKDKDGGSTNSTGRESNGASGLASRNGRKGALGCGAFFAAG
jgi:hypothetical protein